jgi:hypothetical protein
MFGVEAVPGIYTPGGIEGPLDFSPRFGIGSAAKIQGNMQDFWAPGFFGLAGNDKGAVQTWENIRQKIIPFQKGGNPPARLSFSPRRSGRVSRSVSIVRFSSPY